MVHLIIHLVVECKLRGPVHYRWMYLVERYDIVIELKTHKYFIVKTYLKKINGHLVIFVTGTYINLSFMFVTKLS